MYANVGAFVNGARPATKAALKRALTDDTSAVVFDGTSMFSPDDYTPDTIPAGVKLSVVGPDPYARRSWYATVERGRDGRVKIS